MGSEIKNLNLSNIDSITEKGVSFVSFWAPWCGPCRMMFPVYEQLANELTDVNICKVNCDEESEISEKFNVRNVPTMIFMKDGKEVERLIGAQAKSTISDRLNAIK